MSFPGFRSSAGQALLQDSSLLLVQRVSGCDSDQLLRGRNAAAAGLFVLETGSAEGVGAGTER